MEEDALERILAWARYLFWADGSRRRFVDLLESSANVDEAADRWHFFGLMSGWYAAEYVVVEGWKEARLQEDTIDELLGRCADLVDLLRRYRNGVFHYQPRLIEQRFLDLLNHGEEAVQFVHYLHNEFLRYYYSFVKQFPGTVRQKTEFEESVLDIVGWVPDDIAEARADVLAQEVEAATAGDVSAGAQELRELGASLREVATETVTRSRLQMATFLSGRRSVRRSGPQARR